jgi:hypothetical protein
VMMARSSWTSRLDLTIAFHVACSSAAPSTATVTPKVSSSRSAPA